MNQSLNLIIGEILIISYINLYQFYINFVSKNMLKYSLDMQFMQR